MRYIAGVLGGAGAAVLLAASLMVPARGVAPEGVAAIDPNVASRIKAGDETYSDKVCMQGNCLQWNNSFVCWAFTSWAPTAGLAGCGTDTCYVSCNNTVSPGWFCFPTAATTCTPTTDPMQEVGCQMGIQGTCVGVYVPPTIWPPGPGTCTYGACTGTTPYPCLPIPQVCV